MTKPIGEVGVYTATHLATPFPTHSGSLSPFLYTEDDVLFSTQNKIVV